MSKKDIIDYVMETPGNTNKKVLGRLIDEVEGVKLPEVTTDDNGDVLTVVEGAWDKAEPSGGGEATVFTVVGGWSEQEQQTVWSLAEGTSFSDIADCVFAGEPIFLCADRYPDSHWPKSIYPYAKYSMDGANLASVTFASTFIELIGQYPFAGTEGFIISSDGTVESYSASGELQ